MDGFAIETVLTRIQEAAALYHRLVLVVGPGGSGKTAILQGLADRLDVPLLNANLELSQRLLELTAQERRLQLPAVLHDLVANAGPVVLLDNTEVLFDPSLEHDPLRLLQKLSRNRTVVASWSGKSDGRYLTYATPEHPEHRRYEAADLVLIRPENVLS